MSPTFCQRPGFEFGEAKKKIPIFVILKIVRPSPFGELVQHNLSIFIL